ncbi:sensor histidine kinase [Streptomyces turgidiscabies]|uniref:histidine kinase n=3 Tax=Streptomyces TaxID=1883 RepID=L7F6T6_STRT8|nr:HAMP domain-containing sensor histidine kinase [Streptomyces turgidiscabies]ELP67293.1 ATPase/histidine kinase/DNA gyrase B/HSP90 domain protein [Streptomyces turgidiscabies Car8]MDX3495633.1 HAMP domain-containing sensor histidine kinase [Streptomyces turgidiscabies]GAQ70323.1 signal transduction histidine-protein kinase [Streptomyces turgidiscabies]
MRRALGSVRARATLGATVVVAVALVAAGTAVLLSLWSNLSGQAGTQAERTARAVAADLAAGTAYDKLSLDADDRPVQVVDASGRLVAASEDLERISGTGVTAVRPQATADDGRADSGAGDDDDDGSLSPGEIDDDVSFTDGSATVEGDDADYRFAAVRVEADDRGTLTVYAGAPLSAEQSAVSTALTVMLIGFPLLLGVVGGVTWLVTRRALRPVEGIRAEMAAITASQDLGRRVPVPDTHDEVARLARTTNETLAALETSVERQRRFVADASHELRSPIASLRTQLEVGAAHPELLDVEGAVEDTVRLQRLAADLLLLARLDAGERPADARFDLAELVREQAEGRAGVESATGEAVEVAGSRGQLGRLVANLLDNAQRHARSAVTVSVRREGARAVVEVADDGDGVPEADRERVFERFVRLDAARSRDDGGAGLGLAIARDVAVRHGGTLTVGETATGGALFELRLPVT